ncbi:MAG TPA: hypothetical protein PKA27_12385 [Fimbriimonadaceae bacterium]|nr:hypothetical protein [Fimbriimonadaceae bacterium]
MNPTPANAKMTRMLLIFAHAMLVVLLNVFVARPQSVTTSTLLIAALAVAGGFGGCIYYAIGPLRRNDLSDAQFQTHLLMALALAEFPALISVFFVGTPYCYGVGVISLVGVLALILPAALAFSPSLSESKT